MKKFYYSFGTDDMFPLKKGWIIMYANTRLRRTGSSASSSLPAMMAF